MGKVFGVPLVIILLGLFIALLVDVPMFLLHTSDQRELNRLQIVANELSERVMLLQRPSVTPTPSVEVSPTKSLKPAGKAPTEKP